MTDKTGKDAYQDAFADFEGTAVTDGSYLGSVNSAREQKEHIREKVLAELSKVNTRLKQRKTRVSVVESNGSVQLRATLPLKPGDSVSTGRETKQYKISLGLPFNFDGLKTAEEEAYALGTLIARQTFEWNDKYLGKQATKKDIQTIGQLLDKFADEYFKTHQRKEKTIKSIQKHRIARIKRYCDLSKLPTQENFVQAIQRVKTDGAKEGLITALLLFCNTFEIKVDFSKYKPKIKRTYRNIPSDEEIEACFSYFEVRANNYTKLFRSDFQDAWKFWRWIYGMIAVFGVRPHELFVQPDIDWWLSTENIDNTWKVNENCKTGSRSVFPLNRYWIQLFDLKNSEYLEILQKKVNGVKDTYQLDNLVQNTAQYFKKCEIPFKPYDLRHAWAIRAHLMGIPIKAAADNLGHGVQVHTQTYQRWFSEENRRQVINQAVSKLDELQILRDENIRLRFENERLKQDQPLIY
jgi:integrase